VVPAVMVMQVTPRGVVSAAGITAGLRTTGSSYGTRLLIARPPSPSPRRFGCWDPSASGIIGQGANGMNARRMDRANPFRG
jgi:hypothetical protein